MATVDTELCLEQTARDSRSMGAEIKKNVRSVKYMQDRYLFKGKRTDNEEWVRGNLIYTFTGTPYIVAEYDHIINLINIDEVDPATICQCTGLKDKNGNMIWENDIMVAHLDDEYPEDTTYKIIAWSKGSFCTKEQGSDDISELDEFDQKYFEVVGNKFDYKFDEGGVSQ